MIQNQLDSCKNKPYCNVVQRVQQQTYYNFITGVSTSLYNEPCPGAFKYLKLTWTCTTAPPPSASPPTSAPPPPGTIPGGQFPSPAVQALATANSISVTTLAFPNNGNWVFSASSSAPGGWEPFRAFNGLTGDDFWSSNGGYATGSGNQTGAVVTTALASGGTVTGQWVQIQLPNAIQVASYSLLGRANANIFESRSPRDFVLLGSNTGASWTALDTRTNINDWTTAAKAFTVTPATSNTYLYYRLAVQAIGNLVPSVDYRTQVDLSEFFLTA